MWPHRADGHVATIVMTSSTTYTPDRTWTPAVAVMMIHVIVHIIKDVVNIGGIMTAIVAVTPLLGLAIETLLPDVGLGLMIQTGHQT